MIELRTLGATELRRDGVDVRSTLTQPKRLALLIYLRLAAPGAFVARDRLLALFWPESDDQRARNALRQSLHFLRRSLGDEVVVTRAEQEVGIDPGRVVCDAVAFEEALARDRLEEALELYRGDLLPGFHVDDTPELEWWIDEKRAELARRAVDAAHALSESEEQRGALSAAVLWAGRRVALDPTSEPAVRRLMDLLARSGERARALEAFELLARRLDQELGLAPSADTAALAERIRAGEISVGGTDDPGSVQVGASVPAAEQPGARPSTAAAAKRPNVHPLPAPPEDGSDVHGHRSSAPADQDVAPGRTVGARPRRIRSVTLIAGAALLVVAGALIGSRLERSSGTPPGSEAPAIAVMPFLDMSEDGGREYLSDGIAEELLNVLARVPGLRVAARTSSFAFRHTGVTADSVGRALRVSHLLEGSVRTDGDRVRVTVQLVETRGGFHLWSETYDRRLDDVFRLQDEISREVVERLRGDLSPAEVPARVETADAAAHELYLRGRHAWNRRTPASLRGAVALFEQAIERDPGYARAWAGLAEALVVLPQYEAVPAGPVYARAEAAAERALALDSTLAEPHAVLGLSQTYVRGGEAESHFRQALRLNPNYATAHHWYSIYFGERGRYENQLRQILLARSLDPLSPIIQVNVGKAYLHLRRFDEALAAYRQLLAMEPDFGFGHAVLAEALAAAGYDQQAAASARRALDILGEEPQPEVLTTAGYALARAGDHDTAARIARTLERQADLQGVRPGAWGPAQVHVGLGDHDRALQWIERAIRQDHWGGRPDLPWFDPLREDPRFHAIVQGFDRGF